MPSGMDKSLLAAEKETPGISNKKIKLKIEEKINAKVYIIYLHHNIPLNSTNIFA
jgi:hypothetical protein